MKTASYASHGVKEKLQHHTIERRSLKAKDVLMEIEYCGVCHTDLHFVNNDWFEPNALELSVDVRTFSFFGIIFFRLRSIFVDAAAAFELSFARGSML